MRRLLVGSSLAVAALAVMAPAVASADTTIDFEGHSPETTITNQYADAGGAGQGVVFGPLPGSGGNGYRPVVKTAPAGQAPSGTQVADISFCNNGDCGSEFYRPLTTGTFENPRKRVSVRVGFAGDPGGGCDAIDNTGCAEVSLQGYNSNGDPIGIPSSALLFKGAGFHTLLSIEQPAASIRGIMISARTVGDNNEPIRIDDLSFDEPTSPSPPDFTLTPERTSLVIGQGDVVRNRIAIGRSGGSNGDVSFALSGPVPNGVRARFEPNQAGGGSTDLVITADPDAAVTGFGQVSLTVTGTPTSSSVGPEQRTFTIGLRVRQAVDLPCVAIDGSFQPLPAVVEVVETEEELLDRLRSGFTGRLVIPGDAYFDLTGESDIPISSGVQLVGARGPLGRQPVIRDDDKVEDGPTGGNRYLFQLAGNNVCVDGIRFIGPRTEGDQAYGRHGIQVKVGPDQHGHDVLITNNDFSRWAPGAAVEVRGAVECTRPNMNDCPEGGTGFDCPEPPATECNWVRPEEAGQVRVERNYFHDGERMYGVSVYGSGYVTVQGNVFDNIRHHISSNGRAYSGFVARFNYGLADTWLYGSQGNGYYASHFDVHGAAAGHQGGFAGEYHEVAYNTMRGPETRAAFGQRGKASELSDVHDNVLNHDFLANAFSIKDDGGKLGESKWHKQNLRQDGNRLDTDHSTEIVAGDFDLDGVDDLFLANGTAWFYSSGGIRPWRYLRASNKRIRDLAFTDLDDDGVTDVLYREPSGRLGIVKSGRALDVEFFTTVQVPASELRFGDFDADGRKDIFYTRNGQWQVRFGATGDWTPTQSSAQPISKLLIGNFDEVPGTDVAAVLANQWGVSSGSMLGWAKLNGKLRDSFEGAVAADFNGDGRTDIGFGGSKWRYSPGGSSPLDVLNPDPKIAFRQATTGYFGGGLRSMTAAFSGDRIWIWQGLDRGYARSEQNMR